MKINVENPKELVAKPELSHPKLPEVQTVNSNGKRLHAVRIVRYEKRNQAENVGKKLKKKYGLDYRILNNPIQ